MSDELNIKAVEFSEINPQRYTHASQVGMRVNLPADVAYRNEQLAYQQDLINRLVQIDRESP